MPQISLKKRIVPLVVVGVLIMVGYTLVVILLAPDGGVWNWLNELIAALVSIIFAIVVGYGLFVAQTNATDNKRREELQSLLEAEIAETLRKLEELPSDTPSAPRKITSSP